MRPGSSRADGSSRFLPPTRRAVPSVALAVVKWGVREPTLTCSSPWFPVVQNRPDGGAATWATITLITGPTVALVLAVVWEMKANDSTGWQSAVVLFFAGLALRRVMSVVEGIALQFLESSSESVASKGRRCRRDSA